MTSVLLRWPVSGSPPRGRGKGNNLLALIHIHGITPAWAGKSVLLLSVFLVQEDHPRVGGEKEEAKGKAADILGSPPRGRGKVSCSSYSHWYRGITPAWAGKRSSGAKMSALSRDHPRVGGEKGKLSSSEKYISGSPPRGRGKAASKQHLVDIHRITPAWAGKRF